MKETVRVRLGGKLNSFRSDWQAKHSDWPFDQYGVAVLPSSSVQMELVTELLAKHPEVRSTQFVERSYTKRELLAFPFFVIWVNAQLEVSDPGGLTLGPTCEECGFPGSRSRTRPLDLLRKPATKKDMVLTDDWESVVSDRLVQEWLSAGLKGATFLPVTIRGESSEYHVMNIEADVSEPLETVRYEGDRCRLCGRFEKLYPIHPSKEIWLPANQLPKSDISFLNASLERSDHHIKLISNRAYQLLTSMKATGWWVQPIHVD